MDERNVSNERLWAYVKGELPTADAKALERRMDEDPGLAVEVGELQMLLARENDPENRLHIHGKTIGGAISDIAPRPRSRKLLTGPWLAAAAALLLAVAAVSLWGGDPSAQEQADEWLAWEAGSGVRGSGTDSLLYDALQKGVLGNWAEAALLLEPLTLGESRSSKAVIYYARALALSGQHEAGVRQLDALLATPGLLPKTRLDVQWYRSLVYAHTGDCEAALKGLLTIEKQLGAVRQKQVKQLRVACE